MSNITAIFISIILQSYPYIIIGAFASAALEIFLPSDLIKKWAGKNNLSRIILFAFIGFIMPICECGIIPVVNRLKQKGVPTGPLLAYLLSAPAFQPIVLFSTYSAFNNNLKIAISRCFGSFIIAIIIAFLLRNKNLSIQKFRGQNSNNSRVKTESEYLSEFHSNNERNIDIHGAVKCCGHNHFAEENKIIQFTKIFFNDFIIILKYLILGAFISALFSFYNPVNLYQDAKMLNVGSIIIMMIMAIVMSVCSEADAFVAYSFNYFPIVSKLAFMWVGPIMDIKLILLYTSVFNKKFIITIFTTIAITVFIFSLLYSVIFL